MIAIAASSIFVKIVVGISQGLWAGSLNDENGHDKIRWGFSFACTLFKQEMLSEDLPQAEGRRVRSRSPKLEAKAQPGLSQSYLPCVLLRARFRSYRAYYQKLEGPLKS